MFVCVGLLGAAAQASMAQVDADRAVPATASSPKPLQLAGAFAKSTNKLGDKYLDGKAGGIYGIGGSEPHVKYFKSRMPKIPRCCTGTSR